MQQVLSRAQIASWLRAHQGRLRAGDKLPSLTEIADLVGLHRDTLYVAIQNQDRIAVQTQHRLSVAISRIESDLRERGSQQTRVMHVSLVGGEPKIKFGGPAQSFLRRAQGR